MRKLRALGRWTIWYRDMIGATIEARRGYLESGTTTRIYQTPWFLYCVPAYRFRVVVQTKTFGKTHAKGVITAYQKVL